MLDLTDETGLLAGRMLADLGADVVQVEPLGGSTARQHAPRSRIDGTSYYWSAYAANKRGICVDLYAEAGQQLVRELAAAVDIVITSWAGSTARQFNLDAAALQQCCPQLIYVAVTPFGLSGPKSDYAATDLTVWASGGPLAPHRDGLRPPLRVSVPQSFLHAAADGANGALLAFLARKRTGRGQVVDVSAQASLGVATLGRVLSHAVGHPEPSAVGHQPQKVNYAGSSMDTPIEMRKWRCADGMIDLHLSMGPAMGAFTNNLFAWLYDHGACPEGIAAWDWRTLPGRINDGAITDTDIEEARAHVRRFLATKTKQEVAEAAVDRRLACVPVFDMADIAASKQLAARGFWSTVGPPDRRRTIPGAFARVSDGTPRVRCGAPEIGEHTESVLTEWLAYDDARIGSLRTDGVVQ